MTYCLFSSLLIVLALNPYAWRMASAAPTPSTVDSYLTAAVSGSVDDLTKALAAGVPIDSKDARGLTALDLAAVRGDAPMMTIVLDHGADPNFLDQYDLTPITYAAKSGSVDALKVLIDHHAALDGPALLTPLLIAAQAKQSDAVRFLLDHGAAVDGPSRGMLMSVTPLHEAVSNQDVALVKLLVERGASVEGHTGAEGAPLFACIGNAGLPDSPALSEIAAFLIARGADVNVRDSENETVLILAAEHKLPHLAETLVKRGADVSAKDWQGDTAVMQAVSKEHLPSYDQPITHELAAFLLAHGADRRQAVNADLVASAGQGDLAGVIRALKDGASASDASLNGRSSLVALLETMNGSDFLAGEKSKQYQDGLAILHTLIAHGAKPAAPDRNGTLPIVAAPKGKLTNYLVSLGADPKQAVVAEILDALARRDAGAALTLIKPGLPVNLVNEEGETSLILAASCDKPAGPALVERLLALGADAGAKDPWGNTALHFASYPEVATALLNHGADVNALNREHETPLFSAVNRNAIGAVPVLLKAGADPSIKDNSGLTALDLAALTNPAIVQLLKTQAVRAKQGGKLP